MKKSALLHEARAVMNHSRQEYANARARLTASNRSGLNRSSVMKDLNYWRVKLIAHAHRLHGMILIMEAT